MKTIFKTSRPLYDEDFLKSATRALPLVRGVSDDAVATEVLATLFKEAYRIGAWHHRDGLFEDDTRFLERGWRRVKKLLR